MRQKNKLASVSLHSTKPFRLFSLAMYLTILSFSLVKSKSISDDRIVIHQTLAHCHRIQNICRYFSRTSIRNDEFLYIVFHLREALIIQHCFCLILLRNNLLNNLRALIITFKQEMAGFYQRKIFIIFNSDNFQFEKPLQLYQLFADKFVENRTKNVKISSKNDKLSMNGMSKFKNKTKHVLIQLEFLDEKICRMKFRSMPVKYSPVKFLYNFFPKNSRRKT